MKKIIILMITFSLTPCAQATGLGRLFFTPEERDQLDYAYQQNATDDKDSPSSAILINGIVQKKGGVRTVWINGVAQEAGNSDEQNPDAQTLAVPGKAQPVRIKVGQKLPLDNLPPPPQPSASDE